MTGKNAGALHSGTDAPKMMPDELASRETSGFARIVLIFFSFAVPLLAMNQLLNAQFFVGIVLIDARYLFVLAAALLPLVFISVPATAAASGNPPWYDWLAAISTFAILIWFAINAERGLMEGWEYSSPPLAKILSGALCLLVLEALRRTSGWTMTIIVGTLALYPIVAHITPNPLRGFNHTFQNTIAYHVASSESLFGIPMRAFAEIVIGFIVFGLALNHTGGGKFFNDLAFALVGRMRGGAAQVGVISSGLQGSISGSVISNVISSGVVTIPAMKRTGFRADYAGAVEAVASTGAVLMPPVMGSTAFVMASFLGMNYAQIALAATVPALLFYIALAVQIDSYSARLGLKGLTSDELPRLGAVLKEGWFYIPVFVLLIILLVFLQDEGMAPFYATALLIAINQFLPAHRMSWRQLGDLGVSVARGLAELVAILMAVGFIIGSLSMTGLAGTLANDLVYLAGGAPLALLLMGAITSFIFGMGMTVTACYIFLAIVLAPPLVKAGLDPLAVHLFIMYWGMVSFITPPVALATFAAAPLAGASAMKIGIQSIRLGTAIYLVPFSFVLNPALILKGDLEIVIASIVAAFIGIVPLSAALQGYIPGIGRIPNNASGWVARALMILGGVLFTVPSPRVTSLTFGTNIAIATALVIAGLILLSTVVRKSEEGRTTP